MSTLRPAHLAPPSSVHQRPVDEKIREARKRWRILAKLALSPHAHILHPSVFALTQKHLRPERHASFDPATKIAQRYRKLRVLPRCRLFHCAKCGFGTSLYFVIAQHYCRYRKRRDLTDEEMARVWLAGGQSGVRNALRVLEGGQKPKADGREVSPVIVVKHTDITSSDQSPNEPMPIEFQITNPRVPAQSFKVQHVHQPRSTLRYRSYSYLCTDCRVMYDDFQSYDLHLNEKPKRAANSHAIPVVKQNKVTANATVSIPKNGHTRRKPKQFSCAACKQSYNNMIQLQHHIVSCSVGYSY